ncbi:MAG: cytochrome-c oxidase, cbb3-type subunit III [Alphaproteobacteria bacterium]|nr:cytochrome-c oxidase, cbb3-type subunit III [Alphaproteobacteria bacterium]
MVDPNKPRERDAFSGVETTQHEWDGIKELNNPAPRTWLWIFYLCIIFSIGYWVVYPAWPTPGGNTNGSFGWTQHKELAAAQQEIDAMRAGHMVRFDAASLEQIQADKDLYDFARAGGLVAFRDNCAACHGTGAEGGKGYPNLNDDDWLWGGKLSQIYATIRYGVRAGHAQGHEGNMLSFGKDGTLKPEEVEAVADYVVHLHEGDSVVNQPAYEKGKAVFAANCVACHGDKGEGNPEMGAPRLSDNIWLYGSSKESVVATVNNGRAGVMPTWEGRLDDRTIKMLSVYVHSLGGGQ